MGIDLEASHGFGSQWMWCRERLSAFGGNIANRRIETKAKLKWYNLYRWIECFFFYFFFLRKYRWTELNLKNSRLKTAVLPKATSSNQTSKSKFEFYNDKLSCAVMFSFSTDESSSLLLLAKEGKKKWEEGVDFNNENRMKGR